MAGRGRSGGSGRSGGGRSGGSRSSGRSGFSGSRSSFNSGSRSSSVSSGSRSSSWSRSGSSGSFSSSHSRPTTNRPAASRSATSSPSGSYTSHRPVVTNSTVTRQKAGRPTGSYLNRRPIGGSLFGGTDIYIGGNIFGGGIFPGSYAGSDTQGHYSDSYNTCENNSEAYNNRESSDGTYKTGADHIGSARTTMGSPVQNTGKPKKGCLTSIGSVLVWVILIIALFALVGGAFEGNGDFTKSTISREKLQIKLSDAAGYYYDECGWIDNRTKLEKGLKDFYDSTGVLPYVYIIDHVEGDYDPSTEVLEKFAEDTYQQLFDDGGHALLVFWDNYGSYEYVLWLGEDAGQLMDTEACDILFDCLDYYYYQDVTDEEFFANAFSEAGERIMRVDMTAGQYIGVLAVAAAICIIAYVIFRKHKARKAKEAERKKRAEEILNAPLEKFGENGDIIDELEKKYEKEI